jgi:hypothetical protein
LARIIAGTVGDDWEHFGEIESTMTAMERESF